MIKKNEPALESILTEHRSFPPPSAFQEKSRIRSQEDYNNLYQHSINNPEKFWSEMAQDFHWHKKFTRTLEYNFGQKNNSSSPSYSYKKSEDHFTDKENKNLFIKWFEDGETNICYNALDRHLNSQPNKTALLFISNDGQSISISYSALHREVCRFAHALKNLGLKKGDRVTIYMPMVPEAAIAMLAVARLGAIHNVVFGGFSAQSLKDRIIDSKSRFLITANELLRGDKRIALKEIADAAMQESENCGVKIEKCVVLERTSQSWNRKNNRDVTWSELMSSSQHDSSITWVKSEDPLFILYTSGSTGKPKGVLHTTAGYMVYTATTFKYVFDIKTEDIFFCTADIGWITGHSYLIYGPLLNGATSVMFEGIPTHPNPGRLWEIIEKEKISILYTAPTAIRALMREGENWPKKYNLSSLRLLGTVGEPINPEAWMWYHKNIGKEKCPIVDTWWQTETGGILISSLPGAIPTKPGSATVPFFGIHPKIIREDGTICNTNEGGYLVIDRPWPGMMCTVFGDHKRFFDTYFSRFSGLYFTGDGARCDEDGYFWIMGRIDDVVNVSGHRLGTAEIESALVTHPFVAEAAVVGFPHELKGQGIHAFVTLKNNVGSTPFLIRELGEQVKLEIGAIAKPDRIQIADALPKTRSGKIMRRILRKIAEGKTTELGDITTLADPGVVDRLLKI